MIFTWPLWRRVNRLQDRVDKLDAAVNSLRADHDNEVSASRKDLEDIRQQVKFLETQAGVMDPDGITKEET